MNVPVTSGIVTALVFLARVLGLHLQRFLPAAHLSKETQEVIKLGTGMLSVLASLVLGLMIASVKTSIEQAGPSVQPLVIVILVAWVAAIFVSFGINGPRHTTMYASS
jgi:hypothetical protein